MVILASGTREKEEIHQVEPKLLQFYTRIGNAADTRILHKRIEPLDINYIGLIRLQKQEGIIHKRSEGQRIRGGMT